MQTSVSGDSEGWHRERAQDMHVHCTGQHVRYEATKLVVIVSHTSDLVCADVS